MLQIILILLGLATPNPDANTQTTNQDQTMIAQTSNLDGDTGGETAHIPPKK